MANPQNMGELANADAVGTVGNSDCGEMLRLWVKFKEQDGKKVIDRATFQSFGCETAIAVASLATELIRGKTAEEALSFKTERTRGRTRPVAADEDSLRATRGRRVALGARTAIRQRETGVAADGFPRADPARPVFATETRRQDRVFG